MSLTVEEQKEILIKEFQQFDIAVDQKLTKDDLYQKLDQKLGKKFERAIADQLIAKLDTDEEGKFVAEQFFGIIIEGEQALLQKIEQTWQFEQENKEKRKLVVDKYNKELKEEKKNEYNIMEGSLLYIKPIEAETSLGEDQTFVKVQCGLSQEVIQWKQLSQFPIQTATEDIAVALFKNDGNELVAIAHIQLNALRDQKKIERWVDMNSFDGRQLKVGKVKLELHWVHSKTELLENVILSWDNQIKQLEEERIGYENDLTTLLEPFPGLFSIIKSMNSYKDNQQFESVSGINQNAKGQKLRGSFAEDTNQYISSSQQSIQEAEVFMVLGFSNLAYLIVALIISYERMVYLDMIISMCYSVEVYNKVINKGEYNITNIKHCSIAALASIALELVWLVLYTIDWWQDAVPNLLLRRAIVVFSFIFIIIKIEIVCLSLYLYSDYSKNPEQKFAQDNMLFGNSTPKASFVIGENINSNNNRMSKPNPQRENIMAHSQAVNMSMLNTPQYPAQPNLLSSRMNSNVQHNNNIYSTADLNFNNNNDQINYNTNTNNNNNTFNNTNRLSQQLVYSNRPSAHPQHMQDNTFRDSGIKNYYQNSPQAGGNFNNNTTSSSQIINQQQYYVSSFNQNNYHNQF